MTKMCNLHLSTRSHSKLFLTGQSEKINHQHNYNKITTRNEFVKTHKMKREITTCDKYTPH